MPKTETQPKAQTKAPESTTLVAPETKSETETEAPVTKADSASDQAAEAAMNAAPEAEVETEPAEEVEEVDDGSVKLPPNEYNYITEVLKSPVSQERYDELVGLKLIDSNEPMGHFYEVQSEVAEIFDSKSKKTIAQSAKEKLVSRGIIKVVQAGNPSKKPVIKLLNGNYSLGKNGRASGTGAKRGRPPGVKNSNTTVTATPGKRGRKSNAERAAAAAAAGESEAFASLKARLMPDPARIEAFVLALGNIYRKYPDLCEAAGIKP